MNFDFCPFTDSKDELLENINTLIQQSGSKSIDTYLNKVKKSLNDHTCNNREIAERQLGEIETLIELYNQYKKEKYTSKTNTEIMKLFQSIKGKNGNGLEDTSRQIETLIGEEYLKTKDTYFGNTIRDFVERNITFKGLYINGTYNETPEIENFLERFTIEYTNFIDKNNLQDSILKKGVLELTENDLNNIIQKINKNKKIYNFEIEFNLKNGVTKTINFTKEIENKKIQISKKNQNKVIQKHIQRDKLSDNSGNTNYDKIINGSYKPKNNFNYIKTALKREKINGRTIIHDNGLDFFIVRKGDTLYSIKKFLSEINKYSYLKNIKYNGSRKKTKHFTFNIPANRIKPGMFIPIPLNYERRELSDIEFTYFLNKGLQEIKEDPYYGENIKELIGLIGEKKIIALALATAKQESGGKPIGNLALHRWEIGHKKFSFSYFHVLMNGAGFNARKNLNLTEGELMYPQNAMKIFLAFIIEKNKGKKLLYLFPIEKKWNNYANIYNGTKWKIINPHYVTNIKKYYKKAEKFLNSK